MWRVIPYMPNQTFAVQADSMEFINGEYFSSEKFKTDLKVANCVVFHSLFLSSLQKLLVLSRIPKQVPIVWRGWGYDYYSILQANGLRLLLPETYSLTKSLGVSKRELVKQFPGKLLNAAAKKSARQFISKFLNGMISKTSGQFVNNTFIARVNYFSCCVPDDFAALQKALPHFKAQFLPLNYYSTEDVFLRGDNLQDLTGDDILLGNSATPTNNHIEGMRALSKLGIYGRKVIVPLSYGDMKYQEKIIQAGYELLGDSFVPLTKYMPLSEYNQTISNCGNYIMNHIRQQAIGNISSALLRGGKVFLRPENPIYKYYTRMGVILFPFSDDTTIADLDRPLNKDDASKNKEIMMSMWSREQGLKNVKAILQLGK